MFHNVNFDHVISIHGIEITDIIHKNWHFCRHIPWVNIDYLISIPTHSYLLLTAVDTESGFDLFSVKHVQYWIDYWYDKIKLVIIVLSPIYNHILLFLFS